MYDFGTGRAQIKYGAGEQFKDTTFKFPEGSTRVRILAVATDYLATHFIGKNQRVTCVGIDEGCPWHGENAPVDEKGNPRRPTLRKLAYLSIRDGDNFSEPHLCYLTYTISAKLEALSASEDWEYSEMPMPYDVVVSYDPEAAGSKMYDVQASPKKAEIPDKVLKALAKMKPLDEIVEAIKNKQIEANNISLSSSELSVDPPGFGGYEKLKEDDKQTSSTVTLNRKIPAGDEGKVIKFILDRDPAFQWWDKTKLKIWLMANGGYKPGATWAEVLELLKERLMGSTKTEVDEIPF